VDGRHLLTMERGTDVSLKSDRPTALHQDKRGTSAKCPRDHDTDRDRA